MKVIYDTDQTLPIKSWCMNIEDGALKQASNLSKLPFAFKHICLMPDTHPGYGMPIGGVLATQNVIVPNAVGVDIGCGMLAMQTNLTKVSRETLQSLIDKIKRSIPVGFNKHDTPRDESQLPWILDLPQESIVHQEYSNARLSIGTLGGGNHFIEIQKGSDGNIWIMIHSGSRNLGKKVADFYNKKAIEINRKYFVHYVVPIEWELAYLPLESQEGQEYFKEMKYCVDFAEANRKWMADEIQLIFWDSLRIKSVEFKPYIDVAHNYVRMENHFGRNVMVHRKGATSAREDEIGIIPGSQGTSSYIVKGKGNLDSFTSCSHGAGRKMGRKEAERSLDLIEEQKKLDDKGILHSIKNIHDLDEASGAYKDIDIVMEEQKDLVDIVIKLEPLAVIKG